MDKHTTNDHKLHPIRVAVRRSGLTSHAIRVWERRYQAVVPGRTPTNRRAYSDQDIERLRLLHQATVQGHSISRIARLSIAELTELVRSDLVYTALAAGSARTLPAGAQDMAAADVETLCNRCLEAVQRSDGAGLQHELTRAATTVCRLFLLEDVLAVLLQRVGDLWQSGSLRINQEHLAASVVRAFLDTMLTVDTAPVDAPAIVVTTPSGQLHELGAMMAAALASAEGWRVVYLGPDLPAPEIAAAVRQQHARAVGLSIVYAGDDLRVTAELTTLRRALGEAIPVLAGGRAVSRCAAMLEHTGITPVHHLGKLPLHLTGIRQGV